MGKKWENEFVAALEREEKPIGSLACDDSSVPGSPLRGLSPKIYYFQNMYVLKIEAK